MLRLVIYVSEYCGDSIDINVDLDAIRDVSKKRNLTDDITGILLYQNRHFVQAIEGQSYLIEALLRRLKRDPRHRNIEMLVDISISQRLFGDWNMDTLNLDRTELFNTAVLIKLHDAYSKNVKIRDANFVCLLQDMLNTPGAEDLLNR